MTEEERKTYSRYRIKTSKETYEAAKILAKNKFWNSAVNRLYYALFYAVNALLVFNKIQTKSHSATKSQFSLYFIKSEKLDKRYGRLLSELFDWRQKGDYDNIYDFDEESVMPLFEPVLEMIEKIEDNINKSS